MPFSSAVKARIFVRCARICCLCFKQTGARIEAAHIVAEADGGSNEDENAIPLCFDCHEEIGSYNPRHPKGNKFTNEELIQRRNALYQLVDKGIIQAQIIAARLGSIQQTQGDDFATQSIKEVASAPAFVPSEDARDVLEDALKRSGKVETFPGKLRLLSETDRAFVLEKLIRHFGERPAAEAMMNVIGQDPAVDESLILLEKIIRQTTLKGTPEALALVLELVPLDRFVQVDAGLREVFFENIVAIMNRDQFEEVNLITPAVVRVQAALPPEVRSLYISALIRQAHSDAWKGAPAAQSALLSLPSDLVEQVFLLADGEMLYLNWRSEPLRNFLKKYRNSWPSDREALYSDFLALKMFDFADKHLHDVGTL
jgi:hypothetical protein